MGREGKGREGKGREGKGREGKGREGKGREGKGREGKGREGKGREGRKACAGGITGPHLRTQWSTSTLCSVVHRYYSDLPGPFRNTVRCTRHTLSTMLYYRPAVSCVTRVKALTKQTPGTATYSVKGRQSVDFVKFSVTCSQI